MVNAGQRQPAFPMERILCAVFIRENRSQGADSLFSISPQGIKTGRKAARQKTGQGGVASPCCLRSHDAASKRCRSPGSDSLPVFHASLPGNKTLNPGARLNISQNPRLLPPGFPT